MVEAVPVQRSGLLLLLFDEDDGGIVFPPDEVEEPGHRGIAVGGIDAFLFAVSADNGEQVVLEAAADPKTAKGIGKVAGWQMFGSIAMGQLQDDGIGFVDGGAQFDIVAAIGV